MRRQEFKPLLVTGGAGFIGCNLADRLARVGYHVLVLDSLARAGVDANLDWLLRRHPSRISFLHADVTNRSAVDGVVRDADGVFHLAAQVAVTSSLDHPHHDLDTNIRGTLNVLEAARRSRDKPPVIFASTNKVYGNLGDIALAKAGSQYRPIDDNIATFGISEARALSFHTPYGCSKGAADQYVVDYASTFGLPTCVLRMSCIYGPHQLGTEDQGWVAHFARRALDKGHVTIYGDGCQVRDVLYIDDAVDAYLRAFAEIQKVSGRAFNLGGGAENAISLLDLVTQLEVLTGRRLATRFEPWRPGDQRYFVSDTRAIRSSLALPGPRPWRRGLERLLASLRSSRKAKVRPSPRLNDAVT